MESKAPATATSGPRSCAGGWSANHNYNGVTVLAPDGTALGRIATEFKTIAVTEVDCRHDIPNEQPEALIAHVRKFLG